MGTKPTSVIALQRASSFTDLTPSECGLLEHIAVVRRTGVLGPILDRELRNLYKADIVCASIMMNAYGRPYKVFSLTPRGRGILQTLLDFRAEVSARSLAGYQGQE